MDEIRLITIGIELVILLGLFKTRAMVLVGLSMDPMWDLDRAVFLGLDLYLDLLGTC